MARSDITNPPLRTIQRVRPLCMSNIARRFFLARPGQQFYPANGEPSLTAWH
jgi:hypothetical protein